VSGVELERKLAEKGFDNADREDALAILRRTGLVDDDRYATARASALASRGAGDALIRHDLERAGLAPETIEAAFAELESEAVRARRIVDRRGDGPRTRRYLAGKGFSDDAIDVAVGGSSCW
jgi:SOS response regulatory protein OraA/RecX